MTWFGRDPSVLVSGVVAALIAILAIFPLDEGVMAAVTALVMASGGVIVAVAVVREGQLPAILALVKAGVAFGVILGWNVSEPTQASILIAVEAVLALFIRTQVVAPIDANGNRVVPAPPERLAT